MIYHDSSRTPSSDLRGLSPRFFRLVSYRYGHGSALITTNKSVRDWTELLAWDEVLTSAILDRLLYNAYVINIEGEELSAARPGERPHQPRRLT